jgi:hypothetical protein
MDAADTDASDSADQKRASDARLKRFTRARLALQEAGLVGAHADHIGYSDETDKTGQIRTLSAGVQRADRTDTDSSLKDCPVLSVRPYTLALETPERPRVMNAQPIATFRVGDRYHVTVHVDAGATGHVVGLRFEWDPAMPASLSDHERADYRRGRDAAIEKFTGTTANTGASNG